MYDYNASHLNYQATLLEEFHKIQKYLIEHPLYQIYQSSADYVAGVNEYYINEVAVREGGTLSVGDVVLFSNVYYGVITEINEETEMFTIAQGISFRGATGETGPRGGVGPRGLPGADGTNGTDGTDGKNGLSIYLYDGVLNDTLTTAYVAQIHVPTGYTVKTGDILFSTLETSYGAMSLVTSDADDVSTLVSIDYIGQLAGASGGKVIRDIDGNIPASALENISVSVGTASNGVTYIRASMKGEVTYNDNTYDTINYYIDLPIKAGDGVTIEAQPLEGGTGNKQLVISASGGGGVSDVQINGATIVADGVANIPYASATQSGAVNTTNQTFRGIKTFRGGIKILNDGNIGGFFISNDTTYTWLEFIPDGSAAHQYRFYDGSNKNNYLGVVPNTRTLQYIRQFTQSGNNASFYLDCRHGTNETGGTRYLMSAPNTWSTGTSGSVTLPSAGLYEFKFSDGAYNYTGMVNWDGTNRSASQSFVHIGLDAPARTMTLSVETTGVMTVIAVPMAGGSKESLTGYTISYRKIGIA